MTILYFIIIITLLHLGILSYLKNDLSKLNQNLNLFLCHKALNTYQAKLINENEKLNNVIRTINVLIIASATNPPLLIKLKRVKKVTQVKQKINKISFLKNITKSISKGCKYNPSLIKTPYLQKRSFSGELKLRRRRWKSYTIMKAGTLKVLNQFINGKYKQKTKMAKGWQRFLFSLWLFHFLLYMLSRSVKHLTRERI